MKPKQSFFLRLSEWVDNLTPGLFFVMTAALFGLIFILITPPFEAPDEPVHFFRSYQVSTLNLSVDKVGNTYGGILPDSLQKTVALTWDRPALAFHPNIKYPLGYTRQAFSIPNTTKQHVYDFSTTAPYSPVSYIPQAIGIGLARLLRMPPIMMMYMGRLFNLVAWISMFYLAIKLMPRKKWVVAFIGLIPMALFQASSLSSDVMAIGLLVVFIAWLFSMMEEKEFLTQQKIVMVGSLLSLLALSKQVMFLFVPLVLLLPGRLFRTRRAERLIKILLVAIPILLFGLWMLHISGIPLSTSVDPINPHRQLKFVILHPYSYINVLWNTYFYSWGDGITRSFIGNFGWVDTPLSEVIVVSGYLIFFMLLFANTGQAKPWLSKRQKIAIALVSFIYFITASTALYIYFTPVGFKIINGMVGRYFLPIAVLIIPLAYSSWLRTTKRAYLRFAIGGPLFLLITSTITIFVRYYINNV